MTTVLAVVIGGLYAAAIYTLMRPSLFKLAMGLVLLGHAGNLLIFTAAGLTQANPPLIAPEQSLPLQPVADPLPQALILTAIVINFGTLAFALVLAYRAFRNLGTDRTDEMRRTDR